MAGTHRHWIWVCLIAAALGGRATAKEEARPLAVFEPLPVREATVFKDGHAFLLHEGTMPVDGEGNVLLNQLPRPVLGTFWSYAAGDGVKLTGVVAGRQRVRVERTALNLPDLLRANKGKRAIVTEMGSKEDQSSYEAVILGYAERSAAELEQTNPPESGEVLPQIGELILLKTDKGIKALSVKRILDVTFLDGAEAKVSDEEMREILTLRLEGAPKNGRAEVGLVYLQRGLRWIPSYRVTLDDQGKAHAELQATLVNELADLHDVKLHLAVGVPTFKFQDEVDPISLQRAAARMVGAAPAPSRFDHLSNAIMSQRMMSARPEPEPKPVVDLGPAVEAPGRTEDLYLFTLEHVTLKQGERLNVTLAKTTLPYEDIYTVELPFAAPTELVRDLNNEQRREMARLMTPPRAMHQARLTNTGPHPLTTAPALVLKKLTKGTDR